MPRVPVADNLPGPDMPIYRNLWDHIGKGMPKKGRGKSGELDPLKLPNELQTALYALYGHYEKTFEQVGITTNSFSSLSMDPPLVLWPIAHASRSSVAFENAKHFAVNILAVEQVEYSQRFACPAYNKFEGADRRPGALGSPILPNVLAALEWRAGDDA
jgi:hypothetical protein